MWRGGRVNSGKSHLSRHTSLVELSWDWKENSRIQLGVSIKGRAAVKVTVSHAINRLVHQTASGGVRLEFFDMLSFPAMASAPSCLESRVSKSGEGSITSLLEGIIAERYSALTTTTSGSPAFLQQQKSKLPFYLYAYCLMPNHVHVLIEMQDDPVSRIMQRVLTSYSQYHNRKHTRIGHLFQGRYKSILCQSDRYLGELVRYIHLNPVRAKMVKRPERYEYSGHRAYIGLDKSGLVDAEPVLGHFGGTKKRAVEVYTRFVESSLGERSQENYYRATEGRLLGSEDFVEDIKHRVGEHRKVRASFKHLSVEDLLGAAEKSSGLSREELSSKSRDRRTVAVREDVVVVGRERGSATASWRMR